MPVTSKPLLLATVGLTLLGRPALGQNCDAAAQVDTTAWRRESAGSFSLLLPPGYRAVRVQGIDSDVRRWVGPGRRSVHSDAGFYTNRLEGEGVRKVCLEGEGEAGPRIVLLREDGEWGAGLYWPHPTFEPPRFPRQVERFAVGVTAWVRRPADLPELLTIIRSVRLNMPVAAPEDSTGSTG